MLEKNNQLESQNKEITEQIDSLEQSMSKQDLKFKKQLDRWYRELDQYKDEIAQSTRLAEEKQIKTDSDIAKILKFRETQRNTITPQDQTTEHQSHSKDQLPGPASGTKPSKRTQLGDSYSKCAKEE